MAPKGAWVLFLPFNLTFSLTKQTTMITKKDLDILRFHSDRQYAFQKRMLERKIKFKFERLRRTGFHTPTTRILHEQQIDEAETEELFLALTNLRADIEAEFFGTNGLCGLQEKIALAETQLVLVFGTNSENF
jgi:hypothetical protein